MKRCRPLVLGFGVLCCFLLIVSKAASQSTVLDWPREVPVDQGKVVIYQPQLESFSGNTLSGRVAVSFTPTGGAPVFGAVAFDARMATDLDARTATLESIKVTQAKFPDQDPANVQKFTAFFEREIPTWNIVVSIDQLTADLDTDRNQGGSDKGIKNDPPEVIYVEHPVVLVLIDGDPIMADLENSDLKYVANTPFYILQDPKGKPFYLRGGNNWYVSNTLVSDDWQVTTNLPQSVQAISKQIEEDEKKQQAESDDTPESVVVTPPPKVFVRTHPAELLETDGTPAFAPIEGTNLLYMENTESDILMDITTQEYFILISGRWYKSTSMTDNSWAFVPNNKLPADFAKIPADSNMGQVLVSVAGTQQSQDALLQNTIPQTAEVDRKTATVTVSYDGDPKFETCGEGVAYAVNTDKSVLLVGKTYYCCDEAIWFVSNQPTGPWQVATEVPKEIQDIPPECPAYNVKYVYIYESTPEVVYVGYTPAYYGSYVYAGCVVYGTGWYYHPWYGHYYYPRPVTWGFSVHYNSVTGWGFSYGVSYGWLHVSVGRSWYGGWWGPCGYRYGYRHGYYHGYNHGYHQGARAGYRAGYRAGQASNSSNLYKNRQGVARTTTPQTANRKTPTKAATPNNVYAGKNGQVYRQQGQNWQQKDKSGWSNSKGSSNVNRDASARNRGNNMTQQNRKATQNRSRQSRGGRRR